VAEVIGERYELEQMVGAGGMSRVFRARDTALDRTVALKLLHAQYMGDDGYVERFQREARAVAQLSHPNIVTVIDRGEDGGRPFIVFEYVPGENLRERVVRCGPLSVREVLQLGIQIARALAFAHEHGLVHRDVKPQNVIVNEEDGRAQVTDFGIARSLDVDHGMTMTGTIMGTSNYISPEQARGERVDASSDIYSLGAVLFELLTGTPPFEGDNFVAVAMQHVNAPAPSILERRVDCPLRLSRAIDRALAKKTEDRFPSMDAFAAELQACLAELGEQPDLDATLIRPPVPVKPPRRRRTRGPRRRGGRLVVLGILLLLVAAAIGAYAAWRAFRGGPEAPTPAVSALKPVRLEGVGALDPYGDHSEHADRAASATDRDRATYWKTESYRGPLSKPGIGLVVQTATPVALRALVVDSSTPGFRAVIRTATSADGASYPGAVDSAVQTVTGRTVFRLQGKRSSYWVVWITELPPGGVARITEVRASA